MLVNYLKITFRNLKKNTIYTSINVLSLAVGLACSILLLVFIQDELSYDTHYKHYDDLYRINVFRKGEFNNYTQAPFGKIFNEENDDIVASRAIRIMGVDLTIKEETHSYRSIDVADPTITEVFEMEFIKGDSESLKGARSVIISESVANRLFQGEVGETVELFGTLYIVKGIFKDFPPNSHVHYEFIFNYKNWDSTTDDPWQSFRPYTYVRLLNGITENILQQRLDMFVDKYIKPRIASAKDFRYVTQKVKDIHLSNSSFREYERTSSYKQIYTMSAICIMILLIACINFMNLSTARAGKRAMEVGLRKTLGANRVELVTQFLLESLIVTFFGFALAILLVELFLPTINVYYNKSFTTVIEFHPIAYILFFVLYLIVAIGAGSYPAFYLSRFNPIEVIKGLNQSNPKGLQVRKYLVILQFVISTVLLICAIGIIYQIDFLKNKNLGYQNKNLYTITLESNFSSRQKAEAFRDRMLSNPMVTDITLMRTRPSDFTYLDRFWKPNAPENEFVDIQSHHADINFINTYKIEILEGRTFIEDVQSDVTSSILINEEAAKKFGISSEPVGKILYSKVPNTKDRLPFNNTASSLNNKFPVKVVGVVKNYHHTRPTEPIKPLVIYLTDPSAPLRYITFRSKENVQEFVEKLFKEFYPNEIFNYRSSNVEYGFQSLEKESDIVNFFGGIGIILSCAGLFGLVSFTAEQKTKEIGVRKILGASTLNLTNVFTKEFGFLIGLGNLLAFPIAYFIVENWLTNFPYRIDIGFSPFIWAVLINVLVTTLTISYQVYKSSIEDPILALRHE